MPTSQKKADGGTLMATAPVLQPAPQLLKVEVAEEDGPRLLWVLAVNKWPTTYLGKNVFLVTQEQAARIKEEGISFVPLTSNRK